VKEIGSIIIIRDLCIITSVDLVLIKDFEFFSGEAKKHIEKTMAASPSLFLK